jgi:tetratricopeptide (TPR) repeat protein
MQSSSNKVFIDKKNIYRILLWLGVCLLAIFVLLPTTQYKLGNVFFGSVPALYNVNLSQYFFLYAAYPPVGKAPEFAHYQLSRTYFIQGKLQESLEEAYIEVALYPDNIRTYYILGLTYGYLNQEQEAIKAFSKFIDGNPNSWAARNDKAWLQFRIGDIKEALETVEPVAHVYNPWIQNTYGILLLNLQRNEEARRALTLAHSAVLEMTDSEWGAAYPGNDPRTYSTGRQALIQSIESNLKLLAEE